MNGGTFNYPTSLSSNGAASTSGTGGCVFNDSLNITNTGNYYFTMGSSGKDIFSGIVNINNTGTHEVYLATGDSAFFNDNIIVSSTNGGGVVFGSSGGVSTLASGKTISVGSGGFTNDYLTLKNFIQLGTTSQSITLTGTAIVNLISCTFNGNLTFTAPGFLLKDNVFNGTATLTRNGSSGNHQSDGGNTFNNTLTIDNAGSSGRIRMATTTGDTFNSDVTFNSSGGQDVQICYAGNSYFYGDITINSNKVVFNTASGKVTFAGGNSQSLNGSYNFPFKKLAIDKSANHVTANTTLSVDDTLFFVSGNIVTTSSNLLTMKAGSVASGASNSSFVSGPVKKVGNTAFEFPVGKIANFRAITITAPSNTTDAFTGEFILNNQTYGNSFDTSLVSINPCDYWTLSRNSGTSQVKITLNWNSSGCNISYPSNSRVASWNGTKWLNLGYDSSGGNLSSGFVKSLSNSTYYTAFLISNISTAYVGAPDLNEALDFALLSSKVILSDSSSFANGKVGCAGIVENVISNDSIFSFGSGDFTAASLCLDSAIMYCNGLSSTSISNTMNGITLYEGVYSIYSNVMIDSTINLIGDSTSIFIFNIYGTLNIDSGAFVYLNGVFPQNIFWHINGEVTFENYYSLPGTILAGNKIVINGINSGKLSLLSRDSILINCFSDELVPNVYTSINQIANQNYLGGTLCTPTDPCNLGYNSNFSINNQIPDDVTQLNFACPWITPLGQWVGTPDYFNVNCPNTVVSIPNNIFGCQNDNSGPNNAYVGLLTKHLNGIDLREYIQQPLQATLQANKIYYSEMFVSLADRCSLSCNSLGMYFTSNAVTQNGYSLITVIPQVQSPLNTQINNKTQWARVSGCFEALGNESFVVLGNFRSDANTQTSSASSNSCPAGGSALNAIYYFIDDVITVPFEVNAGPDATVACDATVDLGLSTCINGLNTGQFTYNWIQLSGQLTPSFSDPSVYNPSITFSNNTGSPIVQVYQVTVTSPDGCTATDIINLTVESCHTDACDNGISYCFENYTVSGSEVWDIFSNPACSGNVVTIEKELRVPAGNDLTIDGLTVRFGPSGKIVIERGTPGSVYGGRLHVKNASRLLPNSDNCMWEGVQIWGYKNYGPYDVCQGVAWFDSSEISYAHCAIYHGRRDDHLSPNIGGFTGGISEQIDNCLFKDNYIGVCYALGYPITLKTPLNIRRCEFVCQTAMRDPYYLGSRSKYFIDINRRSPIYPYDPNGTTSLTINLNLFHNTPTLSANSTIAIRSNSCVGIPILENQFIDVDRGIFFLSSNGTGQKNIVAEENYFENCNIGIYNLSNKANTLYNSTMKDGVSGLFGISVGILNENSVGTTIQSNSIDNFFGGICVTRSGHFSGFPLKIWQNGIDHTPFGLLSGGNNYYSSWWCNRLSHYASGIGWTLYDVPPLGNNYSAKIQEQGDCGNIPPSNQFNLISPSTVSDIENQTSSLNTLIYDVSTVAPPNYIPDVVSANVTVQVCAMGSYDETTYCAQLPSPFRFATEILSQRDTTRDTTMLNILNAEIYSYYVQIGEIDSAISFIDTMQLTGLDEMLLDLYLLKENTDSVSSIIIRLPVSSEDEKNYKR